MPSSKIFAMLLSVCPPEFPVFQIPIIAGTTSLILKYQEDITGATPLISAGKRNYTYPIQEHDMLTGYIGS